MSILKTTTATVYHTGGRRYFTKMAAYRDMAKRKIRSQCECEPPRYFDGDPGYTCQWHGDAGYYSRAVRLLTHLYRGYDKRANPSQNGNSSGEAK